MPNTPVVAQSPVTIMLTGKQLMVPLSALYFNAAGEIKADIWPSYPANADAVDAYLARLKTRGVLKSGATPLAEPAFGAVAAAAGAGTIVIDVSNVVPNAATPANSTADVAVTETNTYTGVTPARLAALIGTAAGGGTSPGLVFVDGATAPAMPRATPSTALGAGAAGDPATLDIRRTGNGTAFTLKSRGTGADAVLTSVEIKDVDATSGTFTLVAKWTKTETATQISGLAASLAYAVVITPPAGGSYRAPAAGQTVLSGGTDPVPAIGAAKSKATIFAL